MNALKQVVKLILLISLFACIPALAEDAADDSTGRDDTQVYHIYEGVDLFSTLKIQYDKPRIVVKSVYPQLQSDDDSEGINNFNQLVMNILQQEISAYKNNVLLNR